jgi:hypothetical protein
MHTHTQNKRWATEKSLHTTAERRRKNQTMLQQTPMSKKNTIVYWGANLHLQNSLQ